MIEGLLSALLPLIGWFIKKAIGKMELSEERKRNLLAHWDQVEAGWKDAVNMHRQTLSALERARKKAKEHKGE